MNYYIIKTYLGKYKLYFLILRYFPLNLIIWLNNKLFYFIFIFSKREDLLKELEEGYILKLNKEKERQKIDKEKFSILEEEKKLLEKKFNKINGKNHDGIFF